MARSTVPLSSAGVLLAFVLLENSFVPRYGYVGIGQKFWGGSRARGEKKKSESEGGEMRRVRGKKGDGGEEGVQTGVENERTEVEDGLKKGIFQSVCINPCTGFTGSRHWEPKTDGQG